MNYLKEMREYYDKVTAGCWSASTRKKYLNKCCEMLEAHPELNQYYILNLNAGRVSNRIHLKAEALVKNLVKDMINDNEPTVYNIDCLKIDPFTENFAGLYIVGDIKYDPTYGKIFLIKCGGSDNIGKRMQNYTTHNPMFFHDVTSLPCDDWREREKTVQKFLEQVAIGRPPFSREWYIVPENTYFKLCEYFKNELFFASVASGRWLF